MTCGPIGWFILYCSVFGVMEHYDMCVPRASLSLKLFRTRHYGTLRHVRPTGWSILEPTYLLDHISTPGCISLTLNVPDWSSLILGMRLLYFTDVPDLSSRISGIIEHYHIVSDRQISYWALHLSQLPKSCSQYLVLWSITTNISDRQIFLMGHCTFIT